ncbi:MAG: hypothetical protein H0U23_14360 [Blastocatellia bacterium]|nr:hypothetical protein [Blastocatellia bacterium]
MSGRIENVILSLMATITIPDDIHAALKERARRNGQTLDQQIVADLASGIGATGPESKGVLAARNRMREANDATSKVRAKMKSFLSAEEIREAIAESRKCS